MKIKRFLTLFLTFVMLTSVLTISPAYGATFDREQYYIDAKARYGEIDLSDPQYISDEDFFGVWDGSSWTKEPYFYYERYPALSKVEEAAKIGDYDTCKSEILVYYRDRYANFDIGLSPSKNIDYQTRVRYEASMDNFMLAYQNDISSRITFDETDEWATANILYDVQSAAESSTDKKPRFQLVGCIKDGYMAEIDTKESAFAPYIRVLVNGAYRNYTAIADTYVSALPDRFAAHGSETTMLSEESVSSIESYNRKDEYTKVSLLQFDFSDLTANDKVTEATLYLHGRMVPSDCPSGIRISAQTKSLYVMPFIRGNVMLDEQGLNYATYSTYTNDYTSYDGLMAPTFTVNPETGKVSGNYTLLITNYIQRPSIAYVATGDEIYAWHTIRMLVGMIRERGDYDSFMAIDTNTENSIDASFYLGQTGTSLPVFLLRFIESEYWTPEVMTIYLKYIWDTAKILIHSWTSAEEGNNWGTYANRGLGVISMFYPEFRAVYDPITGHQDENLPGSVVGGWAAVFKHRNAYKAADDIRSDGSSIEVSNEYAASNLYNLLSPISTAKQVGVDPKEYFSDDMVELMEKNAMDILSHLNPIFGDWQYGDGGYYFDDGTPSTVKHILDLVENPYIEYFTSGRKSGKEPPYLTYLSDLAGKVTFRNSWQDNAVAGHLEASSGKTSHGHTDDLSLTVGAYGNYLLVDPLMGLYSTSEPYESWLSSTRGHNTVEINNTIARGGKNYSENEELNRKIIDGVLQGPDIFGEWMKYPNGVNAGGGKASKLSDLNPENRELNTIYDYVRGETFGYTNNNAMDSDYQVIRDTLFMHKGYFVVTDYIKPEDMEETNSYKQLWHFLPQAGITIDTVTDTVRTNFDGEANIIVANADSENETVPVIKDGAYADGKSNFVDAKYAYYEKTKEGITTFNTLLYPLAVEKDANVYAKNLTLDVDADKANAFEAQIENTENSSMTSIYYYNLFDESLKKERVFGGYSTDGVLALAEETDGGYSAAVLRKGKTLKDNLRDTYLVYSTQDVQDLGVEWNSTDIKLATAHTEGEDALDLTKLTISSNSEVSSVTLNGENVSFKQQGRYVYFGSNPLLVDDKNNDDEDSSADEDETPSHGTSGSIGSNSSGSSGGKGGSSSGGSSGGGSSVIGGSVSGGSNVATQMFKDVSNHWAESYIKKAAEAGIINGDENGNFNPEKSVSRAELLAMAMRAIGTEEVTYDRTFTDVESEHWYAGAVAQALSLGIISPDVWFRPNDAVTREEMCKILVGVTEKLGIEQAEKEETIDFADGDSISSWAKPYVDTAVKLGLMNGMEDNTFRGRETASRAQAVAVIQRAMEKIKK